MRRARSKTIPARDDDEHAHAGGRGYNDGTISSFNTAESSQPIHRGIALHDALVYAYGSTF